MNYHPPANTQGISRRIVIAALCISMFFGMGFMSLSPQQASASPLPQATWASAQFSDTPAGLWVVKGGYLDFVVANNYMLGVVDSNNDGIWDTESANSKIFDPDGYATRGMVAQILFRIYFPDASAIPAKYGTQAFAPYKDVPASDPRAAAIKWCKDMGIDTGYVDENGKSTSAFGPNDYITRDQLARMFQKFVAIYGVNTNVDDLSACGSAIDWASVPNIQSAQAISWAILKGIMPSLKDVNNGYWYVVPSGLVTRAQVAQAVTAAVRDCIGYPGVPIPGASQTSNTGNSGNSGNSGTQGGNASAGSSSDMGYGPTPATYIIDHPTASVEPWHYWNGSALAAAWIGLACAGKVPPDPQYTWAYTVEDVAQCVFPYATDPNVGFVGNIYSDTGNFDNILPKGLINILKPYGTFVDESGRPLTQLLDIVAYDNLPVIMWIVDGDISTYSDYSWGFCCNNMRCVALVGYDRTTSMALIMDPQYNNEFWIPYSALQLTYEAAGSYAVCCIG